MNVKKPAYLRPECLGAQIDPERLIAQSASIEGFGELDDYTLSQI